MAVTTVVERLLARDEWESMASAHAERVDRLVAGHLARHGRKHPVEDFLWQYYGYRPAQLRRWHPGPGVRLADAAGMPRAQWRWYRQVDGALELDTAVYLEARGDTVRFVRDLLSATRERQGFFGCFGLHEWAMVYRATPEQIRHTGYDLRLGPEGTDAVVEASQVRCSHYDAYRFFTPPAQPLNLLAPQRETQTEMEQPACLHAGMDSYKWAFKLAPGVPSELVADAFELARAIRELDMRAAPYDLVDLGYEPIRIETPEGRAEYAAEQRAFAARSQTMRGRIIAACDALLGER
ncbi:3-methyladenine DNA glycosylase [Actinomycetota bacterium]